MKFVTIFNNDKKMKCYVLILRFTKTEIQQNLIRIENVYIVVYREHITISLFGPKVNFMFNILQQLLIKSSFVEAEHEKKRQIEKQEKNLLLKTTVYID